MPSPLLAGTTLEARLGTLKQPTTLNVRTISITVFITLFLTLFHSQNLDVYVVGPLRARAHSLNAQMTGI